MPDPQPPHPPTTSSPTTPQSYTILLCTPSTSTPTFLSRLHRYDVSPAFISAGTSFLNKEKRTLRNWSNVLVLPPQSQWSMKENEEGEGCAEVEEEGEEWMAKMGWLQRWSVAVVGEGAVFDEERGQNERQETIPDDGEEEEEEEEEVEKVSLPKDLTRAVQRLRNSTRSRGQSKNQKKRKNETKRSRLYVLSFVTFESDDEYGHQRFSHFLSTATTDLPRCDVRVHFSGRVADIGRIQTFHDSGALKTEIDADPADFLSLMSFNSEQAYAMYRAWFEEKTKGVEEGVVLTEKMVEFSSKRKQEDVVLTNKKVGSSSKRRQEGESMPEKRKAKKKKRWEPKPVS